MVGENNMHLTAFRFGKPYESLERNKLVHFMTGEPVAEVSQVGRRDSKP